MASIQFTDADRDEKGFVAVPPRNPEPRSLADLLPPIPLLPDQTIHRQPPTRTEAAAMIGLGLLLLALLAYLWASGDARPPAPPHLPAAAPASSPQHGDGVAAPSPIPAAPPAVAGRLLIAFAAPDGQPLGAIESTRAITPTAHYGDDWIQADVAGSGLVWLRASDAPELAITGPDLEPRPAPVAAPVAAPAPPPCAEAGVPGKMVQVCGYEALSALEAQAKQQWIEAYGGNIGTVATPSPHVREP